MNSKCVKAFLITFGICLTTVLSDLQNEIEEAENAYRDEIEETEYRSKDDEPAREERRRHRPTVNCAQDDVESCWPPHDSCDYIPVGESKYNLTNSEAFNVWNCECEREFYRCLHRVKSNLSNRLGELYFLLQSKCFQKTHPIFDCSNFDAIVGPNNTQVHRCIRYILVLNEPEKYQWFDLPFYMGHVWQPPLYMIKDGRY